jgi:hypothetical protein
MITMAKTNGLWAVTGSAGSTQYFRNPQQAAVMFAALVAAHTGSHRDAEILAQIEAGQTAFLWSPLQADLD